MKYNMRTLAEKLRLLIGDNTEDVPEDFLINENRDFHNFLLSQKVPHTYCESKGIHNMDFWQEYAAKFIPMMFSKN